VLSLLPQLVVVSYATIATDMDPLTTTTITIVTTTPKEEKRLGMFSGFRSTRFG